MICEIDGLVLGGMQLGALVQLGGGAVSGALQGDLAGRLTAGCRGSSVGSCLRCACELDARLLSGMQVMVQAHASLR